MRRFFIITLALVTLGMSAGTGHAQRREEGDKKKDTPFGAFRTRWEYKVQTRGDVAGKGSLEKGLNELGADGWELVAVEPQEKGAIYIFKRSQRGMAFPPRPDVEPKLEPRPEPKKGPAETKLFTLRHAKALEAQRVLTDLFRERGDVRFTVDERTNTLIMYGRPEVLEEAEAVLGRLDVEVDKKK